MGNLVIKYIYLCNKTMPRMLNKLNESVLIKVLKGLNWLKINTGFYKLKGPGLFPRESGESGCDSWSKKFISKNVDYELIFYLSLIKKLVQFLISFNLMLNIFYF